jgi:GT2 family glycosyltransferase
VNVLVDFSIILVNYNGMNYFPACLDAIRRQEFNGTWEILVVNNLSTDNSAEWLRQQEDIRLFDPGKNLGFSGANNIGIKEAAGEFVICLNFDCFLTPRFLQEIHDAFRADPDVGMISGKLYKLVNFEKTQWLDSTGVEFTRCFPKDRGEWIIDQGQYDDKVVIFGPSGAAACYRKSALEEVRFGDHDYFDEEMFIYVEDVDLSWRLNLAGWKGRFVPEAVAYHQRGSTREKNPQEKKNYFTGGFGNRLYCMLKNLRWDEEIRPSWFRIIRQEIRFYAGFGELKPRHHLIYLSACFRCLTLMCQRKTWQKREFIRKSLNRSSLSLGFDKEDFDACIIQGNEYNLSGTVTIGDDREVFELERKHLVPRNFRTHSLGGSELFNGTSVSDDPHIWFLLTDSILRSVPTALIAMGLSLDKDSCGQFIFQDTEDHVAISDIIALRQGYHEYLFSLEEIPLVPMGSPFSWPDCLRVRFDPSNRKNVTVSVRYVTFFVTATP